MRHEPIEFGRQAARRNGASRCASFDADRARATLRERSCRLPTCSTKHSPDFTRVDARDRNATDRAIALPNATRSARQSTPSNSLDSLDSSRRQLDCLASVARRSALSIASTASRKPFIAGHLNVRRRVARSQSPPRLVISRQSDRVSSQLSDRRPRAVSCW